MAVSMLVTGKSRRAARSGRLRCHRCGALTLSLPEEPMDIAHAARTVKHQVGRERNRNACFHHKQQTQRG